MTVHIQLDRDTAITSDKYAWHIARIVKSTRDGLDVIEWRRVRHYNNLETLLKAEIWERVRLSNARTYAELLEAIDRVSRDVTAALAGSEISVEVIRNKEE